MEEVTHIYREVQQLVGASLQEESHKVEEALTSNKQGQIPKQHYKRQGNPC
jgi:hypothetical protein